MSETELNVVCKSCGAEVSPYVTECPYCGARVRKRAPDLERGGDGGLEPKLSRRARRREEKARQKVQSQPGRASSAAATVRPWATITLILVPALALLVRIAIGNELEDFGGVIVPVDGGWWHLFTAPFAYLSVGYLFSVGLAIALFGPGIERRVGTLPAFVLLLACGVLGTLAASALADQRDAFTVIAGGNGIALGAIGAWFMVSGAGSRGREDNRVELAGVIISAAVILLLPVVVPTADFWSGLVGGLVGVAGGFIASRFSGPRP